jgi:hypothetical protein
MHHPLRGALAVVLAAIPVHAWIASSTDLTPDEAYYVAAARFGRIPDHPPLLPWMLAPLYRMSWPALELRIRLPAIALSALVAIGIAWLTHELEGRRAPHAAGESSGALLAAVFATWLPIPMAGGFVATPDAPALLATVAALDWASANAPSPRRSALTACLVALGALSKVVVLPIAILAAALAPASPGRRYRERALWLLPLALVCPLLVASSRFQIRHAFGTGATWSASRVIVAGLATLGGALLLWSPPVVVAGLGRIRRLPAIYPATFALVTALLLLSTLARAEPPEPNWWAPAAVPLLAAGSLRIGELRPRHRHACVALAVVPTMAALVHAVRPWLPIPRSIDPTARLHGWRAGEPPWDAPGLGAYAIPAERCVYHSDCDDISKYIRALRTDTSSNAPR